MFAHDGFFGFGGGFMWLLWLLLVVTVIFFLIKAMSPGNSLSSRRDVPDTPVDILKKRYARGEIDDEEYQRRLRELQD